MAFAQSGTFLKHTRKMHSDVFIARRKKEEQAVCDALVAAGWTEWDIGELMPPPKHFKREKRIDFACVDKDDTWCRIDFVLGLDCGGYIFLEVDEHQHRFGYDAMLSCDMKRMSKVMTSLTLEAGGAMPNICWLRYNPNAWHVSNVPCPVDNTERLAWLCDFVANAVLTTPLTVGYAYYNISEGTLDVLGNEEYHPEFESVAVNLTPPTLLHGRA